MINFTMQQILWLSFSGRVVMVTKESHFPYDRPLLSKVIASDHLLQLCCLMSFKGQNINLVLLLFLFVFVEINRQC